MAEANAPSTTLLTRAIVALLEGKAAGKSASRRLMQAAFLAYLAQMEANGEEITVASLCVRLNAPRHLITRLLQSLIDLGLAARAGTAKAGRVYVLSMSTDAASEEERRRIAEGGDAAQ